MSEVIKSEPVRRPIEAAGGQPAQPTTLRELNRFYAAEVKRCRTAARVIKWPQL